jgi:hypothetical protein
MSFRPGLLESEGTIEVDGGVELIKGPEKNPLIPFIPAEVHCLGHEFSAQAQPAIGRVQDEPTQLRRFLGPMNYGDGTHDVAVCFRNPETVALGVESAQEPGDSPSHFSLESRIQCVFLGVEGPVEKGNRAGIAGSVGTNMDWSGGFQGNTKGAAQ